jgi:integrase
VRYSRTTAYKRLLRYLHEEHGAPLLVRAVPKVQVPAPRAVTATNDERQMLLAAAEPALECWILLCSDLAMRAMTAARISPEHYDRHAGTVTFLTKFGTMQTLPVTERLRDLFDLAEARMGARTGKGRNSVGRIGGSETPYIGLLSRLGRLSYVTLQHAFADLRRSLGITRQLTAHDLRRTTAVKVYQVNRDLRAVQALLGHKTLATTLYYLDHRNTPVPLASLELAKLNPTTEAIQ